MEILLVLLAAGAVVAASSVQKVTARRKPPVRGGAAAGAPKPDTAQGNTNVGGGASTPTPPPPPAAGEPQPSNAAGSNVGVAPKKRVRDYSTPAYDPYGPHGAYASGNALPRVDDNAGSSAPLTTAAVLLDDNGNPVVDVGLLGGNAAPSPPRQGQGRGGKSGTGPDASGTANPGGNYKAKPDWVRNPHTGGWQHPHVPNAGRRGGGPPVNSGGDQTGPGTGNSTGHKPGAFK